MTAVLALGLASCGNKELDTDPLGGSVSFAGMAPNPVMRGGVLKIYGHGLDQVKTVTFTGDVSVTSFVSVTKGDKLDVIELVVPLEGPEVGKVTIVTSDGAKYSSFSDLEYTEPIEFDSFTPATALSGDIITITGEYLSDVKSVIFGGDVVTNEIISASRSELQVVVPSNALTGYIVVSDVDEINDENTIPNHIFSPEELTIGQPTVVTAEKATYKVGDEITVTGEHLDMIENVAVPQVSEVEFTVSEDGTSITFYLPSKANDGNITFTSYAGDEFDAGEIETVKITGLAIASLADDGRYKAGSSVEITGDDLDLVTNVEFTGSSCSWYYTDGKIIATVPAGAQDGGVGLTTDSGAQGWTDAIEVVKPVVSGVDKTEAVAGEDEIVVSGEDLDLVTSVTIGTKEQTFIDCAFAYDSESGDITVTIPGDAYTGVLTLTADSGYSSTTDEIAVTYDLAVSITYNKPSYALGKPIDISGKNLFQIEQIYIKGKKVTSYSVKADDAMTFSLPEEIASPGMYRLDLVLADGTELTWPVPFEVTAPYTETYIWQGSQVIDGWSGVTFNDNRFVWTENNIKVGDVIKIYYNAPADSWWDLQLVNGHWGALALDELNGGGEIKSDEGFAGTSSFAFNVTEEVLASLTEDVGWGGAFIINGSGGVEITAISLIQYGASETIVWEGSLEISGWANNEMQPNDLFVDVDMSAGQELRFYGTFDSWWSVKMFDGHWSPLDNEFGDEESNMVSKRVFPDAQSDGYFYLPLTDDIITKLKTLIDWGYWGVIQGVGFTLTKITVY